ncbi:FAD dependent oxidoreductase [Aspergillus ambiguus]|uniref:NAD(P)/FAD-dependent oxidoreductase n=1 Tax=Aspergillus ambiguus TaxID=176160 RepID=UPI003CCDF3CC
MPTVILGGGIIGASIAYYLSQSQPGDPIHIVEPAPQLFSAASGYAAGFLAKDWFAPALAPLGAYSFNLHRSLAAEHRGAEQWGYMSGTALNLATEASKKTGTRGDDWLRDGTSRAETAAGVTHTAAVLADSDSPAWLTKQQGAELEQISDPDTVAVVDPLRLATFLLRAAQSRGVTLHHPAQATTLVTDPANGNTLTGVTLVDLRTNTASTLPCTNLIIAAGPWTPTVFHDLFPAARATVNMTPLAGYSLVLRSPRHTRHHERSHHNRSHAVFTTHPPECGFSPEIFSRHGAEIYIAGLNPDLQLPARAEDTAALFDHRDMRRLKEVTVRLLGRLAPGQTESTDTVRNVDDLEIVREGLCFRPAMARGVPVVARVDDAVLGGVRTASGGGVFLAAGHGPWGISLSVGTGRVVADMVRGLTPAVDVSGLGVEVRRRGSKL